MFVINYRFLNRRGNANNPDTDATLTQMSAGSEDLLLL